MCKNIFPWTSQPAWWWTYRCVVYVWHLLVHRHVRWPASYSLKSQRKNSTTLRTHHLTRPSCIFPGWFWWNLFPSHKQSLDHLCACDSSWTVRPFGPSYDPALRHPVCSGLPQGPGGRRPGCAPNWSPAGDLLGAGEASPAGSGTHPLGIPCVGDGSSGFQQQFCILEVKRRCKLLSGRKNLPSQIYLTGTMSTRCMSILKVQHSGAHYLPRSPEKCAVSSGLWITWSLQELMWKPQTIQSAGGNCGVYLRPLYLPSVKVH